MNASTDCFTCFQVAKEDGFQSTKPGPDSHTDPTSNPTCVTSCSQNGEQTPVLQCVSIHRAKQQKILTRFLYKSF